jgi:hypothetical protein
MHHCDHDHGPKCPPRCVSPTWYAAEAGAVAEETRLLLGGVARAVAWDDGSAA